MYVKLLYISYKNLEWECKDWIEPCNHPTELCSVLSQLHKVTQGPSRNYPTIPQQRVLLQTGGLWFLDYLYHYDISQLKNVDVP